MLQSEKDTIMAAFRAAFEGALNAVNGIAVEEPAPPVDPTLQAQLDAANATVAQQAQRLNDMEIRNGAVEAKLAMARTAVADLSAALASIG
jgi:hypothetical protein